MPYLVTSAATIRDLVAVICNFAQTNGWTVVYDQAAAKGQIGLSKGNCHVALGEERNSADTATNTFTRVNAITGSVTSDQWLVMALATTGLTAGNTRYWGHPGSLVTAWNSDGRVAVNDLTGPMNTVWLFTDSPSTAIHVVVLSAANRYQHFSFGVLDKRGLTHADCAYAVGQLTTWIPTANDANGGFINNLNRPNNPPNDGHTWGFFSGNRGFSYDNRNYMIPAGVLNTSLGFVDGPFVTRDITGSFDPYVTLDPTPDGGAMLNIMSGVRNQNVLGGVPLFSMPTLHFRTISGLLYQYLGDLPFIRLCHLGTMNPETIIKYGSEEWQLFPWKQKGSLSSAAGGNSPQPVVNTLDYAFAYKLIP